MEVGSGSAPVNLNSSTGEAPSAAGAAACVALAPVLPSELAPALSTAPPSAPPPAAFADLPASSDSRLGCGGDGAPVASSGSQLMTSVSSFFCSTAKVGCLHSRFVWN